MICGGVRMRSIRTPSGARMAPTDVRMSATDDEALQESHQRHQDYDDHEIRAPSARPGAPMPGLAPGQARPRWHNRHQTGLMPTPTPGRAR